ncbi:MAG: sugar ABC transporter permease [Clostridia bacterium]|nr:sugar ABC transporter permease [Clostridia bacterium]
MEKIKKLKNRAKINKGDLIFYCLILAWPVLQFCIFYVGVNFNSVVMSFKQITIDENLNWVTKFPTLIQYKGVFEWFKSADFRSYMGVSLKSFFITTVVGVPLGLLFAYYIFKKLPAWGAFRVILYLPQILSGVVVAAIVRWFLSECLPHMLPSVGDLTMASSGHTFTVLMVYNVFISFGVNVLMYSNKMAGISEEIIESAHLDGATGLKEFWYIVLPLTYSTISVFLITAVAGICVSQYGVYDMFAGKADASVKGIGYWFFVDVANKFKNMTDPNGAANLPFYSAIGVTLTVITVPIALLIRWALEKFGPSED